MYKMNIIICNRSKIYINIKNLTPLKNYNQLYIMYYLNIIFLKNQNAISYNKYFNYSKLKL